MTARSQARASDAASASEASGTWQSSVGRGEACPEADWACCGMAALWRLGLGGAIGIIAFLR